MKVTFRVYTYLKAELGKGEICVELPDVGPISLEELLEEIEKRTGKPFKEKLIIDGKIREGIIFMLNGKNLISHGTEEIVLHDGDVVSILPPGSGG